MYSFASEKVMGSSVKVNVPYITFDPAGARGKQFDRDRTLRGFYSDVSALTHDRGRSAGPSNGPPLELASRSLTTVRLGPNMFD
jgi:hypothetical protein